MSEYKSFNDLVKIDAELASKFKQPGDAVRWCMAIEGAVAEWVKSPDKRGQGGKGLWELVCFASVRKGVFEETLPRNKRAALLVRFCPDAFRKPGMEKAFNPDKEISALISSMEHYKHNLDLRRFDKLCDSNIIRGYVSEIEALLDGQELPPKPQEEVPTIEERVIEYLLGSVDDDKTKFPCCCLHVHKDYGRGIVPVLALATYQNEEFLKNDKPSFVWAYEFIDSPLTPEKFYEIVGKYSHRRALIKPYIVSPKSFNSRIIRTAEEEYVGLVLINRYEPMTKNSYIVQRSIEDYVQWQCDKEVLQGLRDMSTTLMIYDSARGILTSSLSDWLLSEHIPVKPGIVIKAPFLKNDDIESKADELTRHIVEEQKKRFAKLWGKKIMGLDCRDIIDLEINPYDIAKENGISYFYKDLPSDEQLGYLEVSTGDIYLKPLGNNYQRDRFTMAHELGHHQLHLSHFRKYHYTSVGENDSTITEGATVIKGEQKWMEHHANHFAACLLMPKELVVYIYAQLHYKYIQQQYGDKLGPLYYNPEQRETLDSYINIVVRMAKLLNVSTQSMQYRLKNLGFLISPAYD